MSPTLVELRVLSGPHLGAAIELGPGVYLVGSDEEADLFLAGDDTVAGRHLELTVRAGADGPEVRARPLEAPAALGGLDLPPAGGEIPPGQALGLGFTALAWRPAGESWGRITLATLEFAATAVARPAEPAEDEASAAALEAAPGEAEPPPALAAAPEIFEAPAGGRWAFVLGLVLLAALLTALIFGDWGERQARARAAESLNARFAQHGLSGVRAEPGPEALVIRGWAADDQELTEAARLALGQPFRVRLEVRVQADRLRAVRETLNARGFFPEVRVLADGRLSLAVYMKDAQVEGRALALLEADLPDLAGAERRVLRAGELRPVLARELAQAGLGRLEPVYLDGRVLLPFQPAAEERPALNAALERVRRAVETPVLFQLADGSGTRPAENSGGLSPAEPETLVRNRLEVMSVNLGALPFVTLRDGQKFFVGALLPDGAALLAIEADRLKLAVGDKIIDYPLEDKP